MEEIMNTLKIIQQELEDHKKEIRKSGENIAIQVTQNINKMLDERFFKLEEKHEKLKEKVEYQEKRIYFLEKQSRQRNIVFFGMSETELPYEQLQTNLINFIKEHFSIDIEPRDIQEIKRIGKLGDRPRPIIVTFTTLGMKINIIKRKRLLRDTQYYLKEDYPLQVLEKRRQLQEQANLEKEKGNKVIIKYDKLIILKPSNKRPFSTSPINDTLPKHEVSIQAKKKNKTLKRQSPTRRSNSVSEGFLKPSILKFLANKNTSNTTHEQDIENNESKL